MLVPRTRGVPDDPTVPDRDDAPIPAPRTMGALDIPIVPGIARPGPDDVAPGPWTITNRTVPLILDVLGRVPTDVITAEEQTKEGLHQRTHDLCLRKDSTPSLPT